jgi:hypothetical protein
MDRVLIDFVDFRDFETADNSILRPVKQVEFRRQIGMASPEEPGPEFRKARTSA